MSEDTDDPLEVDALLAEVYAGEVSVDDPAVRERAATDEEFARALADFRGLTGQIDLVALDQQRILGQALGERDSTSIPSISTERKRLGLRLWLPAVAAAVLAIVWFNRPPGEPGSNGVGIEPGPGSSNSLTGVLLSSSDFDVRLLQEGDTAQLEWDAATGVGWFDVTVFEEDPEGERVLFNVEEQYENLMALDQELLEGAQHPLRVRVELRVGGVASPIQTGLLRLER